MPQTPPALIETMRLADGQIALWPGHRARLLMSAQALGYPVDPRHIDAQIAEAIRRLKHPAEPARTPQTAEPDDASGPAVWRLRLLLQADGQCAIQHSPLPATPEPVQLAWADHVLTTRASDSALDQHNVWLRHKTTHRPWFAAAQDWLQRHPTHFDLLFCNQADAPCEGSRCNLYVRDPQGGWLTPPLANGLLPGVQRQWLLDQGRAREAPLSRLDLETAPALRVSNALRGWLNARLEFAGRIHSFT
ncbi:aminotransferase class IV [Castellaniella hirudinis]|uniref:aminotransferase class IV n=1 Tax=Castellaniella hirudinis TaxID=1144617 RepID=UPI0039C19241